VPRCHPLLLFDLRNTGNTKKQRDIQADRLPVLRLYHRVNPHLGGLPLHSFPWPILARRCWQCGRLATGLHSSAAHVQLVHGQDSETINLLPACCAAAGIHLRNCEGLGDFCVWRFGSDNHWNQRNLSIFDFLVPVQLHHDYKLLWTYHSRIRPSTLIG